MKPVEKPYKRTSVRNSSRGIFQAERFLGRNRQSGPFKKEEKFWDFSQVFNPFWGPSKKALKPAKTSFLRDSAYPRLKNKALLAKRAGLARHFRLNKKTTWLWVTVFQTETHVLVFVTFSA